MSIVEEICRKNTMLSSGQIAMMISISRLLPLAADLAHAQVTVYAKSAKEEDSLVILTQAYPNTSFIQYKPNLIGSIVQSAEEPLLWRTLLTGKPISGQREWALGMWIDMQTFSIRDANGSIIAALSFETSMAEARAAGYRMLMDAAYRLLTTERTAENRHYRPLSTSDGVVIIDSAGVIVYANPPADSIYKVFGISKIVGKTILDRNLNMRLAQKASSTKTPCEAEYDIGNIALVQRAIPVIDSGQTVLIILIISDITELKKKEKEILIKSAVIQEIHHRVKNNLQTIASLLRLQARRTKSAEVKAALRESVNRILSISVVHEFLSQQDAEFIDVAEVARSILDMVSQNMLEPDFNLQAVFKGQTIILPSEQASSLALVINELVQNSIEHGFVGRREGLIGVDIRTLPDVYEIEIYDNGIGISDEFSIDSCKSLGLQIVRTLIENDVGGIFRLYGNKGTHALITIARKQGVN
ncbi:putative sensor histidine kinase pdtaS [bioreactor metagenome]|uniref:histidine kinase n=1 Tax=bioreactor metagenome TaxID=1076179 RepID=A0A644TFF7_9ZZZZ|nr:histidine kinase N-terminal domain-containing protein [Negativicutes bacterium]